MNQGKIRKVEGLAHNKETHWWVLSISQLFDKIEKVEKENTYILEVEYHVNKGFPSSLYIDEEEILTDDEMRYIISDFIN